MKQSSKSKYAQYLLHSTFWLLISFVLGTTYVVAKSLYKSVTEDGKVVYSARPPSSGTIEKTIESNSLPNTTLTSGQLAEIERLKAQAAQAAKLEQNVVLFKAVWCGYCRKAMAYLAEKNIAYQAIDIDTAEGALAYAQQGGGQGIPLLLVKGEKTIGFDNETYDAIFMKR